MLVREKYTEMGVMPDEDDILNTSVSFDGSCQRRGYLFHDGITVVMDLLTGLPLDSEAHSNFCHKCASSLDKKDPEYEQWSEKYKDNCNKKSNDSSKSVDQECAKRIFGRSFERHWFRYTTLFE